MGFLGLGPGEDAEAEEDEECGDSGPDPEAEEGAAEGPLRGEGVVYGLGVGQFVAFVDGDVGEVLLAAVGPEDGQLMHFFGVFEVEDDGAVGSVDLAFQSFKFKGEGERGAVGVVDFILGDGEGDPVMALW